MPVNRKLIRRVINNLRGDRYEHCTLSLKETDNDQQAYCAEGVILQSVDPEGWIKAVDGHWAHRLHYEDRPNDLFEMFDDVDPFYLRPPHDPVQFGCEDQTIESCTCRIIFEMSDDFGKESWPVIADYLEDQFIKNQPN